MDVFDRLTTRLATVNARVLFYGPQGRTSRIRHIRGNEVLYATDMIVHPVTDVLKK